MWSTFLVILGVLHPLAQLVSAEVQCINPHDQQGICINIRKCKYLLDILTTQGNKQGDFLRASVCGYEGRDPRVCCPLQPENNVDSNRGGKKEDDTNIEDILPPECGLSDGSHTKIVGGNPAELGAWPWIAALGYRNVNNPSSPKWLCGGTLITSTHVLTAAHCAYRRTDLFMVRVGALHLNDVNDGAHPVDLLIQQQIIHPQYSPSTFTNDIAVLRLQGSVPLSLHMPICLPLPEKVRNKNYEYSFPFVAGWGSIQFRGPRSLILQEVQLPVVNLQSCKNAYDKFKVTIIDDRVICAGFARGGKDACEGDSGGPLMTYSDGKYYLLGVVSYGHQCALPGIPGVYSNVITFTDFILGALKRQ